jgi:1,4-alpha-glucan branching enzyme
VPPVNQIPPTAPNTGALAIVLHTHMPYVEGFGTWPFGEEWLWEAITTSYLPLLELLDEGAPLTVSLTPVLCDQLEAPGLGERYLAFLREVRHYTHTEDARGLRAGGHETLARELERSWGDYERAALRFEELGGDLLGALAPHARWTSAATHAVLPLLAGDGALQAQVRTGVQSHRARFGGGWRGGFWLPECAHSPALEWALAQEGVRATCVELTSRLGPGSPAHLRPLQSDSGILLVPLDRATMSLPWSDGGYPAHGVYRDYHHHTIHHHQPWANDGSAYDHAAALRLARAHAADFVTRVKARLARDGTGLPGGGLAVCALDTELLGHWWYEGVAWLAGVVAECAAQGLELTRLDEALERCEPAAVADVVSLEAEEVTTWGQGGDLSTWSGPAVADIAFATRAAELRVLGAGSRAGAAAWRELLALQASDWAFMVARGLAVPYARERFAGHLSALERALGEGFDADVRSLRNIAAHAT